jgi:hypothetical protein|nr:MAG TPA: hypothetical protein [Caudoviricetes sp.]
MEKYRLVRMNVVKYTDDEFILEQLLDEGFILEPASETDNEAATKSKKKATKAADE